MKETHQTRNPFHGEVRERRRGEIWETKKQKIWAWHMMENGTGFRYVYYYIKYMQMCVQCMLCVGTGNSAKKYSLIFFLASNDNSMTPIYYAFYKSISKVDQQCMSPIVEHTIQFK